jgi:uncharacterized membrane protein HdeD (DUF308 family)
VSLFTALLLILCGVLAASSFIIGKQPNARQYIDRLTPYQGWIGVVTLLDGAVNFLAALFGHGPNARLLFGGLEIVLGFLMGYGMIAQHALRDNADAVAKAARMRDKLAKAQIPLGLIALVLGAWALLNILIGH